MPPNPQPPTPILHPGTLLRRRFVVGRVLAHTGLSTVYLGWDLQHRNHEQQVVIKRLATTPNPGGLTRRAAVRAFRQEAALLASLDHPQLPRLHAAFRQGDDYLLVMEYIDGVTLGTVMDAGSVAEEVALAIADGLCIVVSYLHRQRIIHADIKPANVMLAANGRVVLLDLGLARLRNMRQWDDEPIGTLPYAPPEQRRGEPLHERSDLYALGVLLTELLGPATRHPAIRHALDRATASHPDDRFVSVGQLRRALHGEDDLLVLLHSRARRLLPTLWTAATLFVVLAALSMLLLMFGPTPTPSVPALRIIERPAPTLTPRPNP